VKLCANSGETTRQKDTERQDNKIRFMDSTALRKSTRSTTMKRDLFK
jgi:hypothetical protein